MLLFLEHDGDDSLPITFQESEALLDGRLAELAEQAGVRPLESFLSASEEEFEESEYEMETEWFDPREGIETVQALLAGVQELDDDDSDWIIEDLGTLLETLQVIQEARGKFYLTMN